MQKQDYINSVNLKEGTDFPYLVLNIIDGNSYPRNSGFQVMHWHEDLQFIYALSGDIEVVTLNRSVSLRPGEAIFINKNVVHMVRKNDSCHYKSFVFPDYFLKSYTGSPANRIVEQLVGSKNLSVFHIENREVHQRALELLKKLSGLEQQDTPLYGHKCRCESECCPA